MWPCLPEMGEADSLYSGFHRHMLLLEDDSVGRGFGGWWMGQSRAFLQGPSKEGAFYLYLHVIFTIRKVWIVWDDFETPQQTQDEDHESSWTYLPHIMARRLQSMMLIKPFKPLAIKGKMILQIAGNGRTELQPNMWQGLGPDYFQWYKNHNRHVRHGHHRLSKWFSSILHLMRWVNRSGVVHCSSEQAEWNLVVPNLQDSGMAETCFS